MVVDRHVIMQKMARIVAKRIVLRWCLEDSYIILCYHQKKKKEAQTKKDEECEYSVGLFCVLKRGFFSSFNVNLDCTCGKYSIVVN